MLLYAAITVVTYVNDVASVSHITFTVLAGT